MKIFPDMDIADEKWLPHQESSRFYGIALLHLRWSGFCKLRSNDIP